MQDHYQILIHDQVIYDWDHLHRRPCHSPCVLVFTVVQTIETTSFENTLIWDHIRDHIHLRPHSFETTFILRPHSFWNHIHFETTFILRPHSHIHFTPHWSEAVLIYCESDFCDLPCTSLRELKFCKVTSFEVLQGYALLCPGVTHAGCKCTSTLKNHRG